jgi:hypothetical protein
MVHEENFTARRENGEKISISDTNNAVSSFLIIADGKNFFFLLAS